MAARSDDESFQQPWEMPSWPAIPELPEYSSRTWWEYLLMALSLLVALVLLYRRCKNCCCKKRRSDPHPANDSTAIPMPYAAQPSAPYTVHNISPEDLRYSGAPYKPYSAQQHVGPAGPNDNTGRW